MWTPKQSSNPPPSTNNLSPFSKSLQQGEVGILLWSSATGSVGHLALEIGGANPIYASFWPKDIKNISNNVACEGKFHSYQEDFAAEDNKEPTHYLIIKGKRQFTSGLFKQDPIDPVNTDAIINKYLQKIKTDNPQWCLGGSASLGFLHVGEILGVSNCTQFVSDLLSAGGINPPPVSGQVEMRATPDGLYKCLMYKSMRGKSTLVFDIVKGAEATLTPIPPTFVRGLHNQV